MQIDDTTRYEVYVVTRYMYSMLHSFFQLLLYMVFQEDLSTVRENVP